MKKILTALLAVLIIGNFQPVEAKTFYGKMKDNLESGTRPDLEKHYSRNKKIGRVISFIPNVYHAQDGAIALVAVGGFVYELIQIPMPKRKFDMQDYAANIKGLKDGVNGKDFLKEALTLRLLKESNETILSQNELLIQLQKRVELLENRELTVKAEIKE